MESRGSRDKRSCWSIVVVVLFGFYLFMGVSCSRCDIDFFLLNWRHITLCLVWYVVVVDDMRCKNGSWCLFTPEKQLPTATSRPHQRYMWMLTNSSLCLLQVYPPVKEKKRPLTRLQERLIKKLGANAYPFFFEVSFCLVAFSQEFAPSRLRCSMSRLMLE